MNKDPANFREYAGTMISVIIIACYLSIGFVHMAVVYLAGAPITFLADWNTTMQSLANIALGYLIGKQTVGPGPTATVSVPVGDNTTTTTSVKTDERTT